MFVATLCRLLFFGGRYVSSLWLARQLGADAAPFLLVVAVVEVLRIAFDFGLENGVLSRLHQTGEGRSGALVARFARHKGTLRLAVTVVGQLVVLAIACAYARVQGESSALLVAAAMQFTALMGYGWLQAHMQTRADGALRRLLPPLVIAAVLQAGLLAAVALACVDATWAAASFEWLAWLGCLIAARRASTNTTSPQAPPLDAPDARGAIAGMRAAAAQVWPLGVTALLSLAYGRIDVFVVGAVEQGAALLTQYLGFQRIASAPLMLASTVASVGIAGVAASATTVSASGRRHMVRGYVAAAASVTVATVAAPLAGAFLKLGSIDPTLWGLQCLVLGLQVVNGFHAARMIGQRRSQGLLRIARNNAMVAVLAIPLGAWWWGLSGVAAGVAVVEVVGWLQYARRRAPRGGDDDAP